MRRAPARPPVPLPSCTHRQRIHVEESSAIAPAQLLELQLRAIRHHGRVAYDPAELRAWCDAAVQEASSDLPRLFRTYVARIDGHLVGYGRLSNEDGLLGALYVEHREMGRGVGTVLLDAMEAAALARRWQELHVHASLNALPFYLRRGFIPLADASYEHPSGILLAMVRMVKRIGW